MPAVPNDAAPRRDRYCLAIETSNPSINAEVALGVLRESGAPSAGVDCITVEPVREVGRNEDDLLPAIDRACRRAGIAARQIARVGVSVGPGGYTSLRVACAAGKMIAEAVGALCVPVSSAAVAALGAGTA
jgi:tRNA A37 threonylcarbamoyladenosine modification protein TsaB